MTHLAVSPKVRLKFDERGSANVLIANIQSTICCLLNFSLILTLPYFEFLLRMPGV